MIVWIVQAGYRADYVVMGVYETKEQADEVREKYYAEIGDSRYNPSWQVEVIGMPVIERPAPTVIG